MYPFCLRLLRALTAEAGRCNPLRQECPRGSDLYVPRSPSPFSPIPRHTLFFAPRRAWSYDLPCAATCRPSRLAPQGLTIPRASIGRDQLNGARCADDLLALRLGPWSVARRFKAVPRRLRSHSLVSPPIGVGERKYQYFYAWGGVPSCDLGLAQLGCTPRKSHRESPVQAKVQHHISAYLYEAFAAKGAQKIRAASVHHTEACCDSTEPRKAPISRAKEPRELGADFWFKPSSRERAARDRI